MKRRPWLTAALATAAVALIGATFSWLGESRFTWGLPENPKAQCEALDAASLPPVVQAALALRYQERVAATIIREPQNTGSNLAFVFADALDFAYDFFARIEGRAPLWR